MLGRERQIRLHLALDLPQVALNWLLQRPSVSSVIIGAGNEEQLVQNVGAAGWNLTKDQVAKLDAESDAKASYPTWHQKGFPMLNRPMV